MVPNFIQHTDLVITSGDMPFSGNDKDHLHGWMRFKDNKDPIDFIYLISLIDVWPPTPLQNYKKPGPGSTASWNVDLVKNIKEMNLEPDAWFYYESQIISTANGYAQSEARISTESGEVIACSRQLCTIYE